MTASFHESFARLERERRAGPLRAEGHDAVTRLRPADIARCPEVFQPREGGGATGETCPAHVNELAHALATKPADARFLDPITVHRIGRRFYVLDGHHRLAAYLRAGIANAVPVVEFVGSLQEAVHEAVRLNTPVHLNMTRDDRNEAAWRMIVAAGVAGTGPSKAQIAALTGVSESGVARMRALYRRLQERFAVPCEWTGEACAEDLGSYREAVRMDREGVDGWEMSPEIRDAEVARFVALLGKTFGKRPHRAPDVFGEALEFYLGDHNLKRMNEAIGFVWSEGREPDDDEGVPCSRGVDDTEEVCQ